MEKTKKILGVLTIVLLAIGASAVTASAKAIGDDYTILGYNAGWVILIIGVVIGLLFASKILKMPKSIGLKPIAFFVAVLVVVGLAMVFVQGPTPTAEVSDLANMEFTIEAEALHTDGTHYPDTTYDEASNLFTVPFRVNDTTNALHEHGDNSTVNDATADPWMNFTIKAVFPDDADDNDLAQINFEITNPTLFAGSDADNYALTYNGDEHEAWWIDNGGINMTVSGDTGGGIEEVMWVNLRLNWYETGLAEATNFDPLVLNVRFFNNAGTWSETYQIQLICTAHFN